MNELAEVLAVDSDDREGIPRLNVSWQWEGQEQALLSSSLSVHGGARAIDISGKTGSRKPSFRVLGACSNSILNWHSYNVQTPLIVGESKA